MLNRTEAYTVYQSKNRIERITIQQIRPLVVLWSADVKNLYVPLLAPVRLCFSLVRKKFCNVVCFFIAIRTNAFFGAWWLANMCFYARTVLVVVPKKLYTDGLAILLNYHNGRVFYRSIWTVGLYLENPSLVLLSTNRNLLKLWYWIHERPFSI